MTLRGPPESLGLEREIRTRKQVPDYAVRCAIEGGHEAKTEIRAETRRPCSRRERWRNHALSQGGLKRSRAPGANPLRNSGANCAGAGSQDSYDGSRVGCVPPGPMRDRAAHTPRWGQESRSHPKPKLRPVRIDVNSRLVTASPRRQSSAGYITNIDWRRRPRNLRPGYLRTTADAEAPNSKIAHGYSDPRPPGATESYRRQCGRQRFPPDRSSCRLPSRGSQHWYRPRGTVKWRHRRRG